MRAADKNHGLTASRVREVLSYDPGSGVFIWRALSHKSMSSVKVGDVAGSIDSTGYIRLWIDGKRYVAHRLAWLYITGEWPKDQIDHIDGNRKNNRLSNLREATQSQNSANAKVRITSALKSKGVRRHECGKFQARIWGNGGNIHLGLFDSQKDAEEAYAVAARKIFGKFARAK